MKKQFFFFSRLILCFILLIGCKSENKQKHYTVIIESSQNNVAKKIFISEESDSAAYANAYKHFCRLEAAYYKDIANEKHMTSLEIEKIFKPTKIVIKDALDNDVKNITFSNLENFKKNTYNEIVGKVKQPYDKKITADSIANQAYKKTIKQSLLITNYYLSPPNSASGIDVCFYFKNLSDKVIKYLYWEGYPINAVGEKVSCNIRKYYDYRGKDIGPYKKGEKGGGCWESIWYNNNAKKLILTKIEIRYMDDTNLKIEGDDLYLVGKNHCPSP